MRRTSCLQDTYLLATQQEVTLTAELAAARAAAEAEAAGRGGDSAEGTPLPTGTSGLIRRRLFCHRSPTDNLLIAMGRWMDRAIPLVPNRYQAALAAGPSGAFNAFSVISHLGWCCFYCREHVAMYIVSDVGVVLVWPAQVCLSSWILHPKYNWAMPACSPQIMEGCGNAIGQTTDVAAIDSKLINKFSCAWLTPSFCCRH